jgi:hypothetical protein
MKCAMHVVSSNVLLQMIKSKYNIWTNLIAFADDVRWIRRCIFEIAHVSHWTIFEAFLWIISISSIFFNWLIISDSQCFNHKCQFQKIVFVKIFLWNWTALTNFSTNRYFKKNKSCFFSMSHIITLIDLIINAFLYMFYTKFCFLRRVTNIKITSINDTYAMFSKNILRFLSLMWFITSIISYLSIIIEQLKISINSWTNGIIININSYSLWHRFETIHAKDIICFTERKILKEKKNSSTLIQSSSWSLNDFASFKNRVNDVFNLFIRCHFQYQELKIVCVTDQTSEMSNF